ncbi:hypothetical protein PROPEN_02092 [Proteus penneri ATCC 35198]|nr:hypothetical protein PROPEN_02092 [Proteus penneri ATCC 35198]
MPILILCKVWALFLGKNIFIRNIHNYSSKPPSNILTTAVEQIKERKRIKKELLIIMPPKFVASFK